MRFRFIPVAIFLTALCACTSINNLRAANDFASTSQKYNELLRWHEMEAAGLKYADSSVQDEYVNRAKQIKGLTVTDYRVISQQCTPDSGDATVIVDIDYYISPSVTVKTLQDVQKWKYTGENGHKTWRLTSPPPEFK